MAYTRDFTVISSSNQASKGFAKDMEKMVSLSPATADIEIAAASAAGMVANQSITQSLNHSINQIIYEGMNA